MSNTQIVSLGYLYLGDKYSLGHFSNTQLEAFCAALCELFKEFPESDLPFAQVYTCLRERKWFMRVRAASMHFANIKELHVPEERIDAIYALLK